MKDPIRFYFDFSSPYAYFALDLIEDLASEHGREVDWRPILMWAVLDAHGIGAPMQTQVKRDYFLHDMARSADFYGVPYRPPVKLPLSSHMAARIWYVMAQDDELHARAFGRDVFDAFFVRGEDISDPKVLLAISARHGMYEQQTIEAIKGPNGRAALETMVKRAIDDRVIGSPYLILDGEGFFGADRLPQLRWRLTRGGQSARAIREKETT